jgi:hypothetical protein
MFLLLQLELHRPRAWCAGRRGCTGHTPDGGAPDGEGARAVHRTEGRRTERAHGPGTHVGGGAGGGRRPAGVVRRTEGRRTERAHGPRARRRGVGRRGRTGHAPDGGAPDGEGARAGHACGWGRRAGVGRRRAGGKVGLFPAGAGGESVGKIWKLLRVCGLGKPYPLRPGLSLNFQRPDPGRQKLT